MKIQELNIPTYSSRAGIIPYTEIDGKIYFCLGRDSKYDQFSDFGGGVKKKESPIDAAIREFREESLGVFSELPHSVLGQFCIFDSETLIIFVKFDVSIIAMKTIVDNFNIRKMDDNIINLEMDEIRWFDVSDFFSMLRKEKIFYSRVKSLITRAGHFVKFM